jgi:hypothetical protein
VLEGGGYTAVNGERTTMSAGDFILTPSWTYHDHGNTGDTPVIWLDGLDVPIVNLFDTSFAEHYPGDVQPNTIEDGDSLVRYGANMLPVGLRAEEPLVADFQLSLLAQPRGARRAVAQRSAARLPRHQDAVREPGDRWAAHADDRRVHAVAAEGLPRQAVPGYRMPPSSRWSRGAAARASARRP